MNPVLGVAHSAPDFDVPAGACDSHVHVFGPFARFPLAPDRGYTPGPAVVEDLVALHRGLRVDRVVIVQASPQGTDNACLVDALQREDTMGRQARGVAVIAAAITDKELATLHRAGVRGVRVNLESAGQRDPAVAARLLRDAATRVAHLGWHVQAYASLPVIASLYDLIMELPTPLVIDHFGCVDAAKGTGQPGFDLLLSLVRSGKAYVKLSAPHRISALPDCADAKAIARALIAAHPGRMLWGTDWPHPTAWPVLPRVREAIDPFDPIDDGNALNRLATWASARELQQILVDNPARLYGF